MKKEDIHWGDRYRILIGSAPKTFLLEFFYAYAIIAGFWKPITLKVPEHFVTNAAI